MENDYEILEKGKKLYPINENCDLRLDNIYTIDNWSEVFYHVKKGKMLERFIYLTQHSEYSEFFKGMNYEYGINNCEKDLGKAFNIYKSAADNSTDTLAMFRMYHIYKKDFEKFNINERQRILEKFYLFKCFSYLRFPIMERNQSLFNRFDIKKEVLIHFEEEDNDMNIFPEYIEHLRKYFYLYNINKNDIDFIECIINIQIVYLDEMNIYDELTKLNDMANETNLEITYKYICLNNLLSDETKEEEFKKLYEKEYYRSYVDYALFLNTKNRGIEALKILSEARNNGILSAGFLYFDIYLDTCDFGLLMKDAYNFSPTCELYNLFLILIDDINIESIFSFYEYFYFSYICIKHYNLGNMLDIYFFEYTKNIVNLLINITKEDTNSNITPKLLVKKYLCDDYYYKEYNLACGVIHYFGIKNILKRDLTKAYHYIKIAYECDSGDSYKRFCYYYIYKISKIFYEEQKLKMQDNKNKKLLIPKHTILISDVALNNIKNKIFNDYYKSLEDKIDTLSSSYFYYLSRLYNKHIGNKGDPLMEFICLKRAIDYRNRTPGSGSIISFYRKYKAKLILEKNKDKCEYLFSHSLNKLDSEGYGEKGDICPICMDKKRNTISLPCKHLFCEICIDKIEKCPICRKNIMVRFKKEK